MVRDIINTFLGAIFMVSFFNFGGKYLLNKKIKVNYKTIILIIFLILGITITHLLLDNGVQMMIVYIVILFTYKSIFEKPFSQCAVAAVISYLMVVIGELLFMAGIGIAGIFISIENTNIFKGNAIANLLISVVAMGLILIIYRPASKAISKIKENNKYALVFIFVIILMAIWSLFYGISLNDFKFDKTLILNGVLIICMIFIGVFIIKQRYDKTKISDEYEKYVEYSKQSERLVEQYGISQHENKNELIIIKSMVHKNNKKLLEYMNEIIASKDNIADCWIKNLKYIPFGGLKGIIHNKVSQMKELGLHVTLDISKSIGKSGLKNLKISENNQLSKIIGVFLDNAREASISSVTKEVAICIYMENNTVIFEIANSYSEDIELSKIYNVGMTTKGKNRGYGLSLVKTIVEENNKFDNIVTIENGYFIQKLKVKM